MSIELNAELFKRLNAAKGHKSKSLQFGKKGLTPTELDAIEGKLGFRFPNDMRFLLENLHDPKQVFFPWKNFKLKSYKKSIEWILSGIEFDIEHNSTWLSRWGERPSNLKDAKAIMREDFANWPRLVPISGHRYLVVDPCITNNPVLSIWQADIICYGSTLGAYLVNEFIKQSNSPEDWRPNRNIPIWSDLSCYGI